MERRSEGRFSVTKPVNISLLGGYASPETEGTVIDASSMGMRIFVPRFLPTGAAVRVDLCDELFVGEICYCVPYRGGFAIGLKIQQALSNLARLEYLDREGAKKR